MLKVNEIFASIQGEGYNTGLPVVFVRLAQCNLKCPFCDTNHDKYTEKSESDIFESIKLFGLGDVVITGGEPFLQDIMGLLAHLKGGGLNVLIETNGTIDAPKEVLERIDWVTMSPKGEIKLSHWDEAKLIVRPETTIDQVRARIAVLKKKGDGGLIYLQPCWNQSDAAKTKAAIKNAVDLAKRTRCRLSLQTHKLIGIA